MTSSNLLMRHRRANLTELPQAACLRIFAASLAVLLLSASTSHALLFDQNVVPDIIFGSGNTNGGFTVDQADSLELGLRAKVPFVGTINSNNDGTYSYSLAETDQFSPNEPRWNFDWTVNTDYNDTLSIEIDDFTYEMGIDFNPSEATNFLVFDPITPNTPPLNAPFFDHSIGTNATLNGQGDEAANATDYLNLIADNNVLQQSWRHQFFESSPSFEFDPFIDGTYDVYLSAYDGASRVGHTNIRVIIGEGGAVIPEPASLAMLGIAAIGFGAFGTRRRR